MTTRDKLTGTTTGPEGRDRAGSGLATDLTRELADRARTMSSTWSRREQAQVVDQVRDFARRHPGLVLMGAFAAGVVAGGLMRGAQGANSSTPAGGQRSGAAPYPIPAQPTGPRAAAPAEPRKHHGDPVLPTEGQGTPPVTPPGTPSGGPAQEAGLHDDWPGEGGGQR